VKKYLVFILAASFLGTISQAQSSKKSGPTLTWDLGGASGSRNGASYSEIHLGLNWHLTDYLTWRNSAFTRQGGTQNSVYGLDTSMRFEQKFLVDNGVPTFSIWGGPGLRISEKKNTALFAEAGVQVKAGGLNIGFGAKTLSYIDPGVDGSGNSLSKSETIYSIVLSGGGAL
jgi:hypothetical protein